MIENYGSREANVKKIDLHIHTKQTLSDQPFEFDLEVLNTYIEERKLDAIAITNHNVFDISQYQVITSAISIPVYPGIEIDIERSHLLLIADLSDVADFSTRCEQISTRIKTKDDFITFEEFKRFFPDIDKYLLIPHYDKKPAMSRETLSKFGGKISAGEVGSTKKFIYCYRDPKEPVPVYFSDLRIRKGLVKFPLRQIYLNIGEITLAAIKSALTDKEKVRLSELDRGDRFDSLDSTIKLSTGLNVILGERSSGKSYTLNRIADEFGEGAKYIKQFELLERDDEADGKKFSAFLSLNNSLAIQKYLQEFKNCVDEMASVDLEKTDRKLTDYLDCLLHRARETEREDTFSKITIFNEILFQIIGLDNLRDLISSVILLISNTEYRSLIDKYLPIESLRLLAHNLIQRYKAEYTNNQIRNIANELMGTIKSALSLKTSATQIPEIDLYAIAMERIKVEKFAAIAVLAKKERIISSIKLQSFQVLEEARPFRSVQELKSMSGTRPGSFVDAFETYADPYRFLLALRNIGIVPAADYYKYFVIVSYRVINKYGFEVSGGERSEFRLLQEISDAQQSDILLIDEPESSFDNLFLKNEVNALIKDLSSKLPVVIVTHNNTVGASIKPDFIIYTKRNLETVPISYEIYSGYTTDKTLTAIDGKQIKNFDIMMNCLEAGPSTYEDRRRGYEMLKN